MEGCAYMTVSCWVEPGNPMRVSQPSGVHRVHPARCSEGILYIMNDAYKTKVSEISTTYDTQVNLTHVT